MTDSDAGETLKLAEKTLHRLARKRMLPGFKAGGSWHSGRSDVDIWVAGQVRDQARDGGKTPRRGHN